MGASEPAEPARAAALEALFQEALSVTPERRAAFLAARCGDDRELEERVTALLAEDARGTRGMLRGDAVRGRPAAEERIDRYRLVRVLGEGGMGTVYLAEQEEPVRRLVALKTIRLGSFSREAAARFAAECQTLAVMDHPGIAKVFDAGVTAGGLPYFVMEYAPGLPLGDHCQRGRLPPSQRLELFAKVCDAVQHAHQKGVVHRDLKPGNVLVDEREGVAQPRVVDFGIARALAGELARAPGVPLADHMGTPAYMSPARLTGTDAGVDTRDDVYSLGVMLYELLTAHHPFEARSRAELARALANEPPAPSARLAALGRELDEVAREMSSRPRALVRLVRGELDALVQKALALEPARRYASAGALAEDVRRFLRHEPLEALPPRPAYVLEKFVRRHWIGVLSSAALLLSLALGSVLAVREWDAAREAEHLRAVVHGERGEADLLVRAFKQALLVAQSGEGTDRDMTVAELLSALAGEVEALGSHSPGAEAALRAALGRAYLSIGEEEAGRQEYLRAYAVGAEALADDPLDRFDVLEGLIESTRRVGDLEGARTYVAQALAVARTLFSGRDARFLSSLEDLLELAAGGELDGPAALAALDVVLSGLPDEIVRGDESGAIVRVLVEAAVALQTRSSPATPAFLAALERRAREVLAPQDVRLVSFLWTLQHVRGRPGFPAQEERERAARELVLQAERRLPSGHWLRSDARRMLAGALLARRAFAEAERELCAALGEAVGARSAARVQLARAAYDGLARALAAEPGLVDGFLASSWRAQLEASPPAEPWWLAARPRLPAPLLERASAFLAARAEPAARGARGLLEARRGDYSAAWRELEDGAAGPAPLVLGLRALCLAHLGRTAEARAEIARLEALLAAQPWTDAELERLADEVRAEL